MQLMPSGFDPDDFANHRHIGPSPSEISDMLALVGAESMDHLVRQAMPCRLDGRVRLETGTPLAEREALDHMRAIGAKNRVLTSMIGMGYYGTATPPAIQRNILENPAWYTAYTPYQPEISQGRLEVLLSFQTMVCELTGLEVANASLLDEATACAEAMTMARRVSRAKTRRFFVDEGCHPQSIAVMHTRAGPAGIEIVVGDPRVDLEEGACFGGIFQYPGTLGHVRDFTAEAGKLHAAKGIAIISADLLALALLKEPGAMGADIAVGTTQRFGLLEGLGGPHAGYIASRKRFIRQLPGRLAGISVDSRGREAYRLSLQTREQHIRREKAKSNICTAQVLPAVLATFYAIYHGPAGLRSIAAGVHAKACTLATALTRGGFSVGPEQFFDTIHVVTGDRQNAILDNAVSSGINLRRIGDDQIGISTDELTTDENLDAICRAFDVPPPAVGATNPSVLAHGALRRSEYLTQSVFNMNRAEAEMTRYMRRLADRDLALDRSMIPLGSCTMKLNAAAEMMPMTWPEFSRLHPYAPENQQGGYSALIGDLAEKLCDITGYDAISFQPNSGAQGEFAGLMAIAAYHRSRAESGRNVCLIPTSAHGTNAASAQMAGMKVVQVSTTDNGMVDLDNFRIKAERAGDRLAAVMITYPSTCGVFEETVFEVSDVTHRHGGQVYLDGANLNALVGVARLTDLGADVSHLNLHKTFCIPHGGGGPGMGPIGVRSHLAPFLPRDPLSGNDSGAVSSSMFGSASILPVSWAYIRMMGGEGLEQATRVAILSANYIATRLDGAFPIRFHGNNRRVAHECIIDLRPFTESAGISVEDVAKRLIDNGFHPPTMSWPVAGTLMIEPTESEPKAELDRFCEAMLAIRKEIAEIENGQMETDESPLRNAPHTLEDVVEEWKHAYSREAGVFPPGANRRDKYWPPVNRVDNVYGDRNIVVTHSR